MTWEWLSSHPKPGPIILDEVFLIPDGCSPVCLDLGQSLMMTWEWLSTASGSWCWSKTKSSFYSLFPFSTSVRTIGFLAIWRISLHHLLLEFFCWFACPSLPPEMDIANGFDVLCDLTILWVFICCIFLMVHPVSVVEYMCACDWTLFVGVSIILSNDIPTLKLKTSIASWCSRFE